MRRALGVPLGVVFAIVVTAFPARAMQPPPQCDPAACPDPVDIAERVACYVGTQLGFQCFD